MAFSPHYYASFSGRINPGEIWSVGFRLTDVGGGASMSSSRLDEYVNNIAGNVADRFTDARSRIPGGVTMDTFKLNAIDPAGHYRDPVTHEHHWDTGWFADVAPMSPEFTCTAVSLLTDVSRGRAHRGRCYWPNFGASMDSMAPPSVTDVARIGIADWHRDLVRDVCTEFLGGQTSGTTVLEPVVASQIDGTIRPVRKIAVGNILDYISTRKNAYSDVYRTIDYTP